MLEGVPEQYERPNALAYTEKLKSLFLDHYRASGCKQEKPVPISSGIDSTTHFVGAAISVLKPYIEQHAIPEDGLMLAQKCLRARNVNRLLEEGFSFEWGACFTNIELITPYDKLEDICSHTFAFFYDILGISKKDLVVRVSSEDADLLHLCEMHAPLDQIEKDTFPAKYYTHSIGMPQFKGRNFNFAIKHPNRSEYKDVGNFIIFHNVEDNTPAFIEIGFGDTTILKEIYGLNHILDAFPLPDIQCNNQNEQRIIEDCIIACTSLFRENVRPSSKNAQTKILYKYMRALSYFCEKHDIGHLTLKAIIQNYEDQMYADGRSVSDDIVEFLESKQERITDLNKKAMAKLNSKHSDSKVSKPTLDHTP